MGWCHEFGCQIASGCDHPMQAGKAACICADCGVVCNGRFDSCAEVWARGPVAVADVPVRAPLRPAPVAETRSVAAQVRTQGTGSASNPTDALAWLRREFAGLHIRLRELAETVGRQEASLLELAGTEASELNVTLAELEGCAGELRSESGHLRDLRTAMTEAMPPMIDAAARHAVVSIAGDLRAELRTELASLAEALPGIVDASVQQAVGGAVTELRSALEAASSRTVDPQVGAIGAGPTGEDLIELMQKAVHESVALAVAESLAAPVEAPPPASATELLAEPVPASPPPRSAPEPATSARPAADDGEVGPDDRGPSGPSEREAPAAIDDQGASVAPEQDSAEASGPSDEQAAPEVPEPVALRVEEPVAAAVAEPAAGPSGPVGPSPVVCALAGLAVGPSLAVDISAALSRARIRRRRLRQAGPPAAGLYRHDPFAGRIPTRLEHFALARRDLAFDRPSAGGAIPQASLVAAGEQEGREIPITLDVAGGLSVVGPEAFDVCRALVVAFLAGGEPTTAEVAVVGDLFGDATDVVGLTRVKSLGPVLDRLEPEVARRSRLVADAGVVDIAAYRARHPQEPMQRLLVATSEMEEPEAERLRSLLDGATGLGLAVLLVDVELTGATTLHLQPGALVAAVRPEGRVDDLRGARLFTMGQAAAGELLSVVASARSDQQIMVNGEVGEEPFRVEATVEEAPIQVSVLGSYRIEVAGQEIRSGLRAKARELLAFYLLHPEGTTLDAATEALWPEADPGRGSEWFWTALGNLRSLLRSATGQRELKVIERYGDHYRVEPVFDVDLWRFQDALARAGANGADAAWASALQEAADTYRDELLAGTDWAWVDVPRDDLRRRAVDILVSLAATRQVAGDVRGALGALQRAVEVDPLAEQIYRRIMRLYARLSRPDDVTATFHQLKSRLAELDLAPTPESAQLCAELCRST